MVLVELPLALPSSVHLMLNLHTLQVNHLLTYFTNRCWSPKPQYTTTLKSALVILEGIQPS